MDTFKKDKLNLSVLQASNLGNLNNAWRQQLRKMIVKLVTHLSAFPATSTPTINSVFGEDDATKIAASVVRSHTCDDGIALAATNDVIFYTMLAILKLQPYANPVNRHPFNVPFLIDLCTHRIRQLNAQLYRFVGA